MNGMRDSFLNFIESRAKKSAAGKKSAQKREVLYGTAQPKLEYSRTEPNTPELSISSSFSDSNFNLSLFEKLEREILENFPDDKHRLGRAYKYFEQEKNDLRGNPIGSVSGFLRSSWPEVRGSFPDVERNRAERVNECPHKNSVPDPYRPGISNCVACKAELTMAFPLTRG